MTNNFTLSGTQAFEAMMAGKQILCRHVEDLLNFDTLDNFPATIFATKGYEFCIKIETIEVAGITFAKPLTPDEVQHGDDVYIVQASGEIHHYKYQVCNEALNQSIARGFAQRDPDNAQLQAEAFCKLFDRVYRDAVIVEMDAQPKQKRGRKPKAEENTASEEIENKPVTETDVDPASKEVVKPVPQETTIETDPIKLVEKFAAQISECVKVEPLLTLRYAFSANGYLEREHVHHLFDLVEAKLIELDPEQYAPKLDTSALPQVEIQEVKPNLLDDINKEAEQAASKESAESFHSSVDVDLFYKKRKQVLINRIYEIDTIADLVLFAPAIPAARLKPADHNELLSIYAERKNSMQAADSIEAKEETPNGC